MKKIGFIVFISILIFSLNSCKKDKDEAKLIIKYSFDENQERLDNFGNPAAIPAGNAAQTPNFEKLGIHSLELINSPYTLPNEGTIIYKGAETTAGGSKAIDFEKEKLVSDGDVFVEIPLKDVIPGTYTYLRNSLAFQKYSIDFRFNHSSGTYDLNSTLVSFIGYNTYIKNFDIIEENISLNSNKLQGYWAVETDTDFGNFVESGQAPGTTVPNILSATSPIPLNSCLVTGAFENALTITGNETEDIILNVKISINNSFEWVDDIADGKYEPGAGEAVVDMGVRGLVVEY